MEKDLGLRELGVARLVSMDDERGVSERVQRVRICPQLHFHPLPRCIGSKSIRGLSAAGSRGTFYCATLGLRGKY